MGWSPLATEVHDTRQYSARTRSVGGVVLHHAATTDAQWVINVETNGSKQVSSHLVVKDNRRAGIVQEQFRAWSLSDAYWDSWALTVECANESTNGWTISDASHESLAMLVANWATRYNFWPHRDGDPKTWTVLGHREVYTIHGGSYATACPGGMDLNRITRRAQEIIKGVNFLMALSDAQQQQLFANIQYLADQANGRVSTDRPQKGQLATAINQVEEMLYALDGKADPSVTYEDGTPVTRAIAGYLQKPATISKEQLDTLAKALVSGIKVPISNGATDTAAIEAAVTKGVTAALAKVFRSV